MKRFTFLVLTAALLVMLLTGCGSDTTNRYNGNVSTTDNGKVNGTNENMTGEFVGENGFTGSENNNSNQNNSGTTGSNGTAGGNNTSGATGSGNQNGNKENGSGNTVPNSGTNDAAEQGTNDVLDNRARNRSRSGWTSGTGRAASGEVSGRTLPR